MLNRKKLSFVRLVRQGYLWVRHKSRAFPSHDPHCLVRTGFLAPPWRRYGDVSIHGFRGLKAARGPDDPADAITVLKRSMEFHA